MFKKSTRAFTLLEMVISVSIMAVIMAVVMFNYSSFTDNLAVSSAQQELAIAIRQAQAYALNVKEYKASTGQFNYAYGVYLNPTSNPSEYYVFADTDGNKNFGIGTGCGTASTECIEKVSLRNGVTVSVISATGGCPSFNSARSMSVLFLRPKTSGEIDFFNNGGSLVCSPSADGQVTLRSAKGRTMTVTVDSNGQIYAQ